MSAPGGGVCSWGVSAPRGVSAPGGGVPGLGGAGLGGSGPGGAWSRGGGCLLPGGVVSQHALRQTPPCGQNHRRL